MKQATLFDESYFNEMTMDDLEYERAFNDEYECYDEDMAYFHAINNPEYEYYGDLREDEDTQDCTYGNNKMHITDIPFPMTV